MTPNTEQKQELLRQPFPIRIGWYYPPTRTTNLRTGEPLKHKVTFRYIMATENNRPFYLDAPSDRLHVDSILRNQPSRDNSAKRLVVFIPQELWEQINFDSIEVNWGYPTEPLTFSEQHFSQPPTQHSDNILRENSAIGSQSGLSQPKSFWQKIKDFILELFN